MRTFCVILAALAVVPMTIITTLAASVEELIEYLFD